MSHVCADFSPGRIDRAICKFYQIKCVLDVGIKLIHRHDFSSIKLASHSTTDDWERFRAKIFCELKIFKKAKSETLKIIRRWTMSEFCIPAINDHFAIVDFTNGFLPLIPCRKVTTFHDASTWK